MDQNHFDLWNQHSPLEKGEFNTFSGFFSFLSFLGFFSAAGAAASAAGFLSPAASDALRVVNTSWDELRHDPIEKRSNQTRFRAFLLFEKEKMKV